MSSYPALAASRAVEGGFVFSEFSISATTVAGPSGSARAGAGGIAIGRFVWIRPDGVALNQRTSPDDVLGYVLPEFGPGVDWRRVFYDEVSRTWRIRQGMNVSLLASGNVWARFAGGAYVGDQVYANVLDGSAISGQSVTGELTPWFVATAATPGQIAAISTWSKKA